jgi:hypothetical protein
LSAIGADLLTFCDNPISEAGWGEILISDHHRSFFATLGSA